VSKQQPSQQSSLAERLGDEIRFFRTWAARPLKMGAVTPSSRAFARTMVELANPDPELYTLETGAGTGVITEALLERGIPPEKLVVVEYESEFCDKLRERFPGINLIQGDAFNLDATLGELKDVKFGAYLSGVPMLTTSKERRLAYVEDALDRLVPGACLAQLSYSLTPPVPAIPGRFTVEKSRWITFNLPPGRVWIYRRAAA
jgi:phosphatidylethanolamine/phosphatidyl-N-methylethanolamine N-methyltransferase